MSTSNNTKPQLLIVDDVVENLHAMMAILRDEFAVLAATNGEKALQLAADTPVPELIILDIQMPDMDGYEVLRRLKANPLTAEIPVIFVTALSDDVNEALGLDLGAVDYITKPANSVTTLLRVRHQIALKRAQMELRENEVLLRTITDAVQSGVVLIDDQDVIQFANPAAEKLFGYDRDELKGKQAHKTLIPTSLHSKAMRGFKDYIVSSEGPILDMPLELLAKRKDGSDISIELYVCRIRHGDSWWTVGAAIDITKHKNREAQLVDQAGTDSLTGVRNRRSFMRIAENMLNGRRQGEEETELFILMFDLDHFKRINDNHGHAVGDQVLRAFANLCVQNLRDTDLFARIGGEEFAAVLLSRDLLTAENIAERIRVVFNSGTKVEVDGNILHLETSVSIGLAKLDMSQNSVDSGLKRADTALYQAKNEGRNRIVVST
ncbi:MAG: diguanylate cyclase [Candidatus Thiodiazotropha sp.]|jgi:two-component system, cell cycle response regulator